MSKMPAKKKSCFQITSVTQAQVAAIGAADDTESLDDPDESRAEDVSSEIYDMSRAEYEPASDRSPSEEAQNNVVEVEAPANIPQASQLSNKVSNQSGQLQAGLSTGPPVAPQQQAGSVSLNTSQTVSSSAPAASGSTVSCTSRFRVIKLDHGTGEPFRRGRWTCTEFYDKEPESSVGKTGDSLRHASTTLDPSGERDSGLGHTVGSAADTAVSSARIISVETLPTQSVQHTGFSVRQQSLSGTQSAFSNSKPTGVQPLQSSTGGLPPPQAVLPVGQNGLPQPGVHLHKSPVMPPSYPAQQHLPMGHLLTGQPAALGQSQSEYYQPPGPGVLSAGQGASSVMPGATAGVSVPSQIGDIGGSLPTGPPLPQQPVGNVPVSLLVSGSTLQTQYIAAGQPPLHGATPSSIQNVPANAVSSSVPSTMPTAVPSASSAVMPNVTSSALPPAPFKTAVVQGIPAAGLGQVEVMSGRKSEVPHVPGKEPVKPLTDALQLSTPTVNSLFGIHIPVDGDEDSASGTNVVAIDNKIEQAMDLVKSHLMYAVREEVEVLKEQIKELFERNSVLERENAVLKSLANTEQLSQLSAQTSSTPPQPALLPPNPPVQTPLDPSQQLQPNVTSA
ncbi:TSC22 domain family protein 2-like isoform X2 [Boleophthalmus pectinirostris]|uniref:TSC22 domain family protein 2-like isoform X2 n=1 Tax=Boleophthalmus pectinirostris TaxID=150288 RepID=UPI000A1C39EB|nr:TSC22 domain family protein 2-like isoform X2 [Boleophthalmus pectinirostris]